MPPPTYEEEGEDEIFTSNDKTGWAFFFQAEDGIRDKLVTGVQTCALPIFDRAGDHRRVAQARHRTGRRSGSARGPGARGRRSGRDQRTQSSIATFHAPRPWVKAKSVRESPGPSRKEIGRASCRERVEMSVA